MPHLEPLRNWVEEIVAGETVPPRRRKIQPECLTSLRRLHASEDGMLSLVTIVTVMFLLLLASLVVNVGATVNAKIEAQNAADSVAYSSAVWMARGMNEITTTNHLMGEMMALFIVYHAIGGDEASKEDHQSEWDPTYGKFDNQAQKLNGKNGPVTGTPAYKEIKNKKDVPAGTVIFYSKMDLLQALTGIYYVKETAGLLENAKFPPFVALGIAIDAVATSIELVALNEWLFLHAMQETGENSDLRAVADNIHKIMLPNAHQYVNDLMQDIPKLTTKTAAAAGNLNRCTGALFPNNPQLPLVDDPHTTQDNVDQLLGQYEDLKNYTNHDDHKGRQDKFYTSLAASPIARSQAVRATYPWVVYHREVMLKVFRKLKLSHAAEHFNDHTNNITCIKICEFIRDNKYKLNFQVIDPKGSTDDKGFEPWTKDSHVADPLFTLVGFSHHKVPAKFGSRFNQPNSSGIVAYAQGMIYNANPQQDPHQTPPAPDSDFQPLVGWDTLNWLPPTNNSAALEFATVVKKKKIYKHLRPQIQVNWQAKLVPVTRLNPANVSQASKDLPDEFQQSLKQMSGVPRAASLHNH